MLIYISFNFDFLAFEKVYFENNFANELRRSFVFISTLKDSQFDLYPIQNSRVPLEF